VHSFAIWRLTSTAKNRSPTSSPRKDRVVFRPTGFADLAGKRVGIFGYGVEGRATRHRLEDVAASLVLVDDAPGRQLPMCSSRLRVASRLCETATSS
jgi:phosphoglycerate dehydrogenase-like enzyme